MPHAWTTRMKGKANIVGASRTQVLSPVVSSHDVKEITRRSVLGPPGYFNTLKGEVFVRSQENGPGNRDFALRLTPYPSTVAAAMSRATGAWRGLAAEAHQRRERMRRSS